LTELELRHCSRHRNVCKHGSAKKDKIFINKLYHLK